MPYHYSKDKKGKFIQWGKNKKYYYSDEASKKRAKKKASKQAGAIYASGYKGKK